ncbi:hypothetical protein BG011_003007 [Mortierella polycephala]|uniref:MYND-type domain-containing protein n=1 Tax=Mortierella polycephala TaxID=41804 RepID=A0A9P6Q4N2_9FUNG|nr:hypothetical protein BG011_003007 [Mortierella polycephala]
MVRYEKNQGDINIAWGHDEAQSGYFLTIVDKRLQTQIEAGENVNQVCYKVSMDGGGSYFDFNTYRFGGFGHRVSEATIFTFMRRYGIDPTEIDAGQNKTKINVSQDSSESHIDPSCIKQRRAKFQKLFVESVDNPTVVIVARIDRTITELCGHHNIPIVREGLFPPTNVTRTTIFFAYDAYPLGFKECGHPDCRLPEISKDKHKRCAKCKKVSYCSRTCQVADWKEHKADCQ